MQSLSKCFSRLYSTMPKAARVARTASTPRAVKLRRLQKRQRPVLPGETDALPSGLTPTEDASYRRSLALGELVSEDGTRELTEGEWLERLNSGRSRVRGIKRIGKEMEIVGQRVYLPNVIFRLMRNHTPAGQPYNPYEATFRIPQSITKTDLRSYLLSVYGVKTTYIRTDNYLSPLYRSRSGSWSVTKSYKTYKRAVVGLVDPFYYPLALEDMSAEDRAARKKWLEDKFGAESVKQYRQQELLRLTKKNSQDWRWRGTGPNRAAIMKRVGIMRTMREEQIEKNRKMISGAREGGHRIAHRDDLRPRFSNTENMLV